MSTPEMQGEPTRGIRHRRPFFALGAVLLLALPIAALFYAGVERVRDASDRAH
jgi:hypothetical protein